MGADRESNARSPTLQGRIAQLYYAHGLFCSSYPVAVLFFAVLIACLCCYPLLYYPLPGNIPLQIQQNAENFTSGSTIITDTPLSYIQQIVVRTGVLPWDENLYLGDAFRAPLYEAFNILEVVRNHQDSKSLKLLGHVCLHVDAVKKSKDAKNSVLPQYSCLVLSPTNLWNEDVQKFSQDPSILGTIFNYQNIQKGKVSIANMAFGMHLSDTGIKRYPLRNRQRILQYAITIFLSKHDTEFIEGLRNKLHALYPLHQNATTLGSVKGTTDDTIHIYYPGEFNYREICPILTCFCLLFFYYYFSVRKIELVKSKLGMAIAVVATVLFSLSMTFGVCFFFGLTLSLQGKEIFPYLVILVGLENVLVLTKSVVSTPAHLDVKIRVAQGLSKEGWSITKNLLIELTILTVGLFTFVPVIQEFCIFAIAGLISDFFLQMFFFSPILGIDMRCIEDNSSPDFRNSLYYSHDKSFSSYSPSCKTNINRSKSHPRLSLVHTDVVASQPHSVQEKKIPKRLRLVNIWARTRFFQRAFMILMIIWIARILYDSGIIEHYFEDISDKTSTKNVPQQNGSLSSVEEPQNFSTVKLSLNGIHRNFVTRYDNYGGNRSDDFAKLKHAEYGPWLSLSAQHWPAVLRKYNISLAGRSVAILPPIRISHPVGPEQAVLLRHPEDSYGQKFQWQALAAALDPIDFSDLDAATSSKTVPRSERPFYPTSPMEILLTTILCIISVIVLAYALVVLYRCVCSRNYAEWRTSWSDEKAEETDVPVLLEAVPIVLTGHAQEIECIATDGASIASCCLGGQVKIWDSVTGEMLANIDRKSHNFGPNNKSPDISIDCAADEMTTANLSDYESGSPPSRDELLAAFPSFQHKINTNFSGLCLQPISFEKPRYNKYDFGEEYRQLYLDHSHYRRVQNRRRDTMRWVQVQREFNEELDDRRKDRMRGKEGVVGAGVSPIWCMDFVDNLVVVGCADGRLEFWEGSTGKLKCVYEDGSGAGVTSVKIIGSRIVVARLYGTLDFLQLQTYSQGRPIDWNFTCAYRRTHVRTGSAGSLSDYKDPYQKEVDGGGEEDLKCCKVLTTRAHQQPVTCLDCEGGRVVTGSQDHTLRVFRLEDATPLYTFHGHCGPITCLFIDRVCPATAGSGSQDGMLCVWDLLTGTCMYSIQAHDGSITALTYSASYVISLATDGRLCVWERFQGHLLNTIQISHTFPSQLLMLASHLVVTVQAGGLVVWDVRTGESCRSVNLGASPLVFVKQMLMLRDAVLCDYGNQLRIVRFPLITNKID